MKSEIILAPFATVDDYATNIGPTTPRTALDLDAASDAIREYCGWNIYPAITEDLIVDGSGTSVLMVPTMNLTAVTACTETWWGPDQTPVTVDVATLEWSAKGIIRRASGPYHRAGYERQWTPRLRGVTLTVTHGYATPPAALVRLTLDMARRASSNPNALTQQQVGQRMESYAGRGMLLDERDLLDSGVSAVFLMFDDSIDVLTYPTTTDRGRIIPDYTATPTSVSVSGVDLQPGASTELIAQQREGVAVRWTVYVPSERIPAGVVVTAKSIVRVGVDVYQVNGEPMSWAGDLRHIVVALVDWAA